MGVEHWNAPKTACCDVRGCSRVSLPFQDQKMHPYGCVLVVRREGLWETWRTGPKWTHSLCLIAKMQENTKTIPFQVQFWCSEDGGGMGGLETRQTRHIGMFDVSWKGRKVPNSTNAPFLAHLCCSGTGLLLWGWGRGKARREGDRDTSNMPYRRVWRWWAWYTPRLWSSHFAFLQFPCTSALHIHTHRQTDKQRHSPAQPHAPKWLMHQEKRNFLFQLLLPFANLFLLFHEKGSKRLQ